MPQIKSNFTFKSSEPNFARDQYKTLEDMRSVNPQDLDEGHIVYCIATGFHYIFHGNKVSKDNNLGYFRLLDLNDSIIINTKKELQNYNIQLEKGRLAYCEEDNLMYYYTGNYSQDAGYFKLLVDIQDANYVSFDSDDWKDVTKTIDELSNSSMLTFDTIYDMKSYIPTEYINEGQLAYCKELNRHFYLIKDNGEFVKNGYYGYFRLICDADSIEPKIAQPNIHIDIEYNKEEYDKNRWEVANINGEKILLLTDESNEPNIAAVNPIIYRGEIDYTNFPYHEGELKIDYIGQGEITTDMYIKQGPIKYGNNDFYVSAKASTNIPVPVDINGILRDDLKWDKSSPIESNSIIVNKTKKWYASTSKDSDLEPQPLIPWSEEMNGYATLQATCIHPQCFQLPEGRELKSLFIMGLMGYVKEDLSQWNKKGNIYTYTGTHRGPVQIKVVF